MTEVDNNKIKTLIHRIGLLNNLTDSEVSSIVYSQFRFTKDTIKNMQIEELNDEDVDKLKKTFYYKYIGKFYTTSDIIKRKLKTNIKKEEEDE